MKKYVSFILILVVWQLVTTLGLVSPFLLPSISDIITAFIVDFSIIMNHTKYTMMVALIGLLISIIISIILAVIMDLNKNIEEILHPLIVFSQTIPIIALAPLLVIWFGYLMKPKIILVVISTFFPMTISLLNGLKSVDKEKIDLLLSMGANKYDIYKHLKLPSSYLYFMAGLKVSISYTIISTIISEWLGGYYGLGVYMIRVKKSYELDKMFAIIIFTSILSIILVNFVKYLERKGKY